MSCFGWRISELAHKHSTRNISTLFHRTKKKLSSLARLSFQPAKPALSLPYCQPSPTVFVLGNGLSPSALGVEFIPPVRHRKCEPCVTFNQLLQRSVQAYGLGTCHQCAVLFWDKRMLFTNNFHLFRFVCVRQ